MPKKRRGWAVPVRSYSYTRRGKSVQVKAYRRRKPRR